MNGANTPVVVIGGPTASGKSALGLAVASAFGGTVINADSMQLYAELRVLTARPGPEDEALAPHRLYGVLPASERGSAVRWRAGALEEIGAAAAAGRLPVVVGGTGLYLRALMQGLADVPDIPDDVRNRGRARYAELGGEAFRAELIARDPKAHKLAANDITRLTRAWEVVEATGTPLSEWQARAGQGRPQGLAFLTVVVDPPRERLYAACDRRFGVMLDGGALEEVRALAALGLDPALPAMKALGVPELLAHLSGRLSLDEAAAKARQATRNYAKRQVTWFRHQIRDIPLDVGEHGSYTYLSVPDGAQSDVVMFSVERLLRGSREGGN